MLTINLYKKYILTGTLLFLSFFVFTQCGNKNNSNAEEVTTQEETDIVTLTDAQMRHADIATTKLQEQNIATVLKLNGKIDVPPQNLISITNPLGGYVKQTKLIPGMHIKKGELIATMEDPKYIDLQQNYLIAKDKYELAKLDFQRQKELNANQASSDKVFQIAQAEMNKQRITMNSIAQQLSLININPSRLTSSNISKTISIYSPIDGFVSNTYVNVGKYVTPSDVLFELIDPTDIHLNLKVYEKDLHKLEIGQKVMSFTNANPSKKYEGDIILISMDVSPEGTSEVHCHFDAFEKTLIPGMYMNAEIDTHSTLTEALPEESVVYFEGKHFVFIEVSKQTYQMYPVQIGETEAGFTAIANHQDLKDKTIVSKGAYTLLMKLRNTEEEE